MTTTATPIPDEIEEKVFKEVRRAYWLGQLMGGVGEHDVLPRHELWLAIFERLDAAMTAIDELEWREIQALVPGLSHGERAA